MKSCIRRIAVIIGLIIIGCWFWEGHCFAQNEKFFEIRARKFSYNPNIIKVKKGDKVKIRLVSEDVTHGLFIDGYGFQTQAHPGEDGSISFVADKTGRFIFRCSVTCGAFHPYMVGYLVVGPNQRFYLYVIATFLFGGAAVWRAFLKKKS